MATALIPPGGEDKNRWIMIRNELTTTFWHNIYNSSADNLLHL
jgi:hypothetical protein